ncbi:MAG TPA: hypothetical protein VHR66_30400 [Gemmataceae bacterium]|jgi:hypothetical protein|nr:hypothetical protein [Gemmataceae bacterium]
MAIVFNCPHCQTNYRLKDEFGGKTATCKNPNCRKVIPVPKPTGAVLAAGPVDIDALAAAAFSDDQLNAIKAAEEMIQVTCAGCDHVWSVEASKEGKNVLCPECRKPNRVPMRKKVEKADWRSGGGGPSLAKRETGLDREGAFGNVAATGISEGTAREIVKERQAEEEPEEKRKRRIKWFVRTMAVIAVLGVAIYFIAKQRRESVADAKMIDAVDELTKGPNKTADARLTCLIHRAHAEYLIRTSESTKEANDAVNMLTKARTDATNAPKIASAELAGLMAEVANTIPYFVGTPEQVDKGSRPKQDKIVTELRHAVDTISNDPELAGEVVRSITRKLAADKSPSVVEDAVRQHPELIAQIGIELLRVDRERFKGEAEAILKRLGPVETTPALTLRVALGKPMTAKKDGEPPPTPPIAASAEGEAIKGNVVGAKTARNINKPEDKAKSLANVGQSLIDANSTEAIPLLLDAAKLLKGEVKGSVSPWVSIRVCRLLAKGGQPDEAESLAASLPNEELKAWARLEILRGRLSQTKGKADDAWVEAVGDPVKVAAAGVAREEIARHNARAGFGGDYQSLVKKWTPGTVRPFGVAGIVLGGLDRQDK